MSCGSWKNNLSVLPRNSDFQPIPLLVCVRARALRQAFRLRFRTMGSVCLLLYAALIFFLFPLLTEGIFTPQSIGDSCIRGGVSPLAPVHLDNVLRAQQFNSDVKQNNWLRSVGWQGLIWMFFFSLKTQLTMWSDIISFKCSAQQQVL